MYEDINEIESDLKKLLSHFIKILSSFGYDYKSFLETSGNGKLNFITVQNIHSV